MSDFLRALGATAEPRGMHGFAAPAQVAHSSDFGPLSLRSEEYAALANQLDDVVSTMKSLGGILRQRAGGSATYNTDTAAGQAQTLMRKAKAAIAKAEIAQDDSDESPEDTHVAIDRATQLLASVKRILLAAADDEDENEADVESAKASYLKVSKRLASLKAAKSTSVAAAPGTITAESVAALDKQADVLKAQLADVVNLIGGLSRNAGMPPVPRITKASNDAEPSIQSEIARLRDIGVLNSDGAIEAKSIAGRLALAKAGTGSLDEVRTMVSQSRNGVVRNQLFKDI